MRAMPLPLTIAGDHWDALLISEPWGKAQRTPAGSCDAGFVEKPVLRKCTVRRNVSIADGSDL
jgi:hypothetical protein